MSEACLILTLELILIVVGGIIAQFKHINAEILPGKQHDENAFKYYLYEKMYASCFADTFMKDEELFIRKTYEKCYEEISLSDAHSSLSSYYPDVVPNAATELPVSNSDKESSGVVTPHYTADVIRSLKRAVFKEAQVVDCSFKHFNLTITPDGRLDASAFIETFKLNPKIPEIVKKLIVNEAERCVTSSRLEDAKKWGHAFIPFHKMMNYFRCARRAQFDVCFKVDLMKQRGNFDLTGLDGLLEDVPLENRLAFIVSSYANWDHTGVWDM